MPSRLQQVSILLLAAALVAAGVAGGQWFMESDYVVFGYLVRESGTASAWWRSFSRSMTCMPTCCSGVRGMYFHDLNTYSRLRLPCLFTSALPPSVRALGVCVDDAITR